MKTEPRRRRTACFALIGCLAASTALAQEPAPKAEATPPAEPKVEPAAASEKVLAIVGADVVTVTRGTVRRGTVLIRDGKIVEIGQNLEVPEGAERIEAQGRILTPGFVAVDLNRVGVGLAGASPNAKIGDSLDPFDQNLKFALAAGITSGGTQVGGGGGGGGFRFPSLDDREIELSYDDLLALHDRGELSTAQVDALLEHARLHGHAHFDGEEPGLVSARDPRFFNPTDGVGACAVCGSAVIDVTGRVRPTDLEPAPTPAPAEDSPEFAPNAPSKPTASKYAVLKLTFGELEGMLVTETPFYAVQPQNLTGPANVYAWRQAIEQARDEIAAFAKHEAALKAGQADSKAPEKKADEQLIRLVKHEIALRTQASTVEQIRHQIALARELDYRLVIEGAHEGWLIPDELAAAGVAVIVTPRDEYAAVRGREGRSGTSIETCAILERTGVPFSIASFSGSISLDGVPGRDLASTPLEATFAVRGGASESAALRAITIEPARALGVADRVGSIEVGKDADLLILDGPPLDYRTYVQTAIVNGKVRYERDKDRVLPVFERSGIGN